MKEREREREEARDGRRERMSGGGGPTAADAVEDGRGAATGGVARSRWRRTAAVAGFGRFSFFPLFFSVFFSGVWSLMLDGW